MEQQQDTNVGLLLSEWFTARTILRKKMTVGDHDFSNDHDQMKEKHSGWDWVVKT